MPSSSRVEKALAKSSKKSLSSAAYMSTNLQAKSTKAQKSADESGKATDCFSLWVGEKRQATHVLHATYRKKTEYVPHDDLSRRVLNSYAAMEQPSAIFPAPQGDPDSFMLDAPRRLSHSVLRYDR